MREPEIRNAQITSTSITMEDHGVLTFWIFLVWPGGGVGVGGYVIGKGYLGAKEFSVERGDGLEAMMRIMDVVGVEKWEDLKGKYVRFEDCGLGSTVHKIGNLLENKWFDLKEFFERKCKEAGETEE